MELSKEKEDREAELEEKMDRWVYLNDLAERIEAQKNQQTVKYARKIRGIRSEESIIRKIYVIRDRKSKNVWIIKYRWK